MTASNAVPFKQTIQCANVMKVPVHGNVVLQPEVVETKATTSSDFYLPQAVNSSMSQVLYATSNKKTPDENMVSISKMETFS